LAALICFAQSTQILFQRTLYRDWSAREIAGAWLVGFGDLAIIGAVVLAALMVVGGVRARSFALRAALFAVTVLIGAFVGEWLVLWPRVGRDHPRPPTGTRDCGATARIRSDPPAT
jgi:hypothetical protein